MKKFFGYFIGFSDWLKIITFFTTLIAVVLKLSVIWISQAEAMRTAIGDIGEVYSVLKPLTEQVRINTILLHEIEVWRQQHEKLHELARHNEHEKN